MISFVDSIRPKKRSLIYFFDLFVIITGSLFIALLAQVSIPLGFTPVPLTLQTLGVLMIGALVGSKRGALSVLTYITEGALGLPVFAGGSFGFDKLLGPTGGYLLGFIVCAYVVGFLLERGWRSSTLLTLVALTIGSLITLAMGTYWLSFFVGGKEALIMGFFPFLIGAAIKILVSAALITSTWKWLG